MRVVKAYVAEEREEKVFGAGVDRLFNNIAKSITGVSTVTAGSTVIVGVIGVVMLVIGGNAILAKTMTLGDFVMYLFFTAMTVAPLVQIASIGTQLSGAFAGLDRFGNRRMATEDQQDASKRPMSTLIGDVRFDGVSFEYAAGVPVLTEVSFHAPAGSTTALVGSSGSGKSTLISLIMTFNRPKTGTVVVDGQDLEGVRLRDYRSHLGIVLQDNFLFDGTVADNITYARPDATRADVERVSRIAHCDEFVQGFPEKYDTVVGERGVRLSGGQRQRVAIARALLADPQILILDEATSSLDSESEAMIQEGLRALRHGRTTFVIAHRLSTIQSADQILVPKVPIVERGSTKHCWPSTAATASLLRVPLRATAANPGEDLRPSRPSARKRKPGRVVPPGSREKRFQPVRVRVSEDRPGNANRPARPD